MVRSSVSSFYNPAKLGFSGLIEPNFFQTWKTDHFDDATFNRLKVFREQNLDFNFEFYDDLRMNNYMKTNWGSHPIFEIYDKVRFGAAKADIWRYCVLFEYGGVYLDIDAVLNFKLSSIPVDINELISFEANSILENISFDFPDDYWFLQNESAIRNKLKHPENLVLNWGLIFRKNHEILKNCIDLICENADLYKGKKYQNMLNAVIHFSGPYVLTRAVWKYLIDHNCHVHQLGIDFDGLGLYKSVINEDYLNDKDHYAKHNDQILLNV